MLFFSGNGPDRMGLRTSSLSLFECHPPSPKQKSTSCWQHKLGPPSYNHNWTDLHYAASQGNLRRIQEILAKSGMCVANNTCMFKHRNKFG